MAPQDRDRWALCWPPLRRGWPSSECPSSTAGRPPRLSNLVERSAGSRGPAASRRAPPARPPEAALFRRLVLFTLPSGLQGCSRRGTPVSRHRPQRRKLPPAAWRATNKSGACTEGLRGPAAPRKARKGAREASWASVIGGNLNADQKGHLHSFIQVNIYVLITCYVPS